MEDFVESHKGLFSNSKYYLYFYGLQFWELDSSESRGGLTEARRYIKKLPKDREHIILRAYPKHDDGSKLVVCIFLLSVYITS